MNLPEDIKSEILAYTLKNSLEHGGKPSHQAILGKILANHPELKANIPVIQKLIDELIQYVSTLSIDKQQKEFEKYSGYIIFKPQIEEKNTFLPELPNRPSTVVTRFAPNPDGPIHIGNLRAAVLSHSYARMYKGKFVLRLEDTDPKVKPPMISAYEWIKQDLIWLGLNWDEFYIQSDRFEIYYEYALKLTEKDDAYVCECSPEEFRSFKMSGKNCPHRSRTDSVAFLQKMIAGLVKEGKAVLRLKTSMDNPNPALRDPPLMRVINTEVTPHPRVGAKYKAFPLYNFSAAIDDSLMGITLVLRGKEHLTNSVIQASIQEKLGLKKPITVEFGRLNLEGYILSKSKIKKSLRTQEFRSDWPTMSDGWDDPRLATVMGLRRRGIQPRALVELMLEVGPKPVDASISWDNLAAINRRIIEPVAKRFFAVFNPQTLTIRDVSVGGQSVSAKVKVHPSRPELGERKIELPIKDGCVSLMVAKSDLEDTPKMVRLMDLFNVEIQKTTDNGIVGYYKSTDVEEARRNKYPIIQWVPITSFVSVEMYRADGLRLEKLTGTIESSVIQEPVGSMIQLVRIGYARIDANQGSTIRVVFTHD
ncbi:MAG: glutamate--tRNA ligase [Thermoprotei archaeon]